ncbi:protein-L-isoaspartate(D-aspartate) O-methyltransferase [Bacteroidetes/Chlorobi group bacterium MS-B_bin-24]|jgi:protein-L-isoaspartate(D-aspartate) O-methyltransferase|nr:MAG: protein-L-isoaspartate(D-aspartate) O-methyltransferase [Bacteroidetes/Chlorobi group bacterium MS-B_bin-24]
MEPKLNYQNNYQFKEARFQLVDRLRQRGIKDERILSAMNKIPRELFVDPAFVSQAYEDIALPIDCNQTISQPYTVAFMTQALNLKEGSKVLEIGTGSGYQATLLYLMGMRVYTIERIYELYLKANRIFQQLGVNVLTRWGDGSLGWKEYAPYDGIIVTAAAPKVPEPLLEQLAINGRLVIPVGDRSYQAMYIITKVGDNQFQEEQEHFFKFVPLIGEYGWQNGG